MKDKDVKLLFEEWEVIDKKNAELIEQIRNDLFDVLDIAPDPEIDTYEMFTQLIAENTDNASAYEDLRSERYHLEQEIHDLQYRNSSLKSDIDHERMRQ